MYPNKILLSASIAAALLFSGAANAFSGTYTETATTGLRITELRDVAASPFLAAAINEAGWTLSTITISETAIIDILAGSTLTNSASGGQIFRLIQYTDFFSTASTADVNSALAGFGLEPTAYNTGFTTLAAGASLYVNGGVTTATATTDALAPIDLLSLAIGGAGSTISATTITTDSIIGGSGYILNHINTIGEAVYTVTFNYTQDTTIPSSVPLPTAIIPFVSGLIGLVVLRRKAIQA